MVKVIDTIPGYDDPKIRMTTAVTMDRSEMVVMLMLPWWTLLKLTKLIIMPQSTGCWKSGNDN